MPRPRSETPRSETATVRLTDAERVEFEQAAARAGFGSVSSYIRHLHQANLASSRSREDFESMAFEAPTLYKRVGMGRVYRGDSRGLCLSTLSKGSVDLIMTSPPFGLVRKKSYGNEDADQYVEWFRPFAAGFRRVLKETGSLVIDIGGAWKRGTPTRSLYHFELLISLCREFGFHLAEEHYWWNPSKLPSPAEWVNVRRVRVKDAVNCIWWLSPTPWPKADNRRVLAPYSESMGQLLKNGYKAKLRPSGHDISTKFQRDNGGSVPPNLLAIANTESNGRYQKFCRENGLPIHPARFPDLLPEYFIRMLTDEGDTVLDPFGGSCVTGAVAERLNRRWICCELDESYIRGGLARFGGASEAEQPQPARSYQIHPPCGLTPGEPAALGTGKRRVAAAKPRAASATSR